MFRSHVWRLGGSGLVLAALTLLLFLGRSNPLPAQAAGTTATQIDAGDLFTCALTNTQSVVCWGSPAYAETSPPSGLIATQVSTGDDYACAVTTAQSVRCWGDGFGGETSPPSGLQATQVGAGNGLTCAVTTAKGIVCWGDGFSNDTTPPSGLTAVQVGAGFDYACALTTVQSVTCWGEGSTGTTSPPSGLQATQVSVGEGHACAATTAKSVVCWGNDTAGDTVVPSGLQATQVSAGGNFSCAVTTAGSVTCWGSNDHRQQNVPSDLTTAGAATQVTTGAYHACALRTDGKVECWGNNEGGETNVPAVLAYDVTAPLTQATLSGTAGSNGWYTSSVGVKLAATDNTGGSGVATTYDGLDTPACTSTAIAKCSIYDSSAGISVTTDGTHSLTYFSTDNAGNVEAANTITIKIDTIKPVITASATTADGKSYTAGNWTNQPVTVTFACTDPGANASGIATNSVSGATVSSEGSAQAVTNSGVCTDQAGNAATAVTFSPIKIDTTAPVITASATTANGKSYAAGTWTNQAVTVSFTCADSGTVQSGITANTVGGGSTVSSNTSGKTVTSTGSCVDNAGNQASPISFGPIKIDTTKPVIAASAKTADGKPYSAGTWTNQPVAVSFSCADSGTVQSGIQTDTVTSQTVSSETPSSGQSVTSTGSCIDAAGNSATPVRFGPVKIDLTKPVLSCSATPASIWPPNHKLHDLTATVSVRDGGAGPAGFTLLAVSASGSPGDIQGFTVGQANLSGQVQANKGEGYTLTYQGKDLAGNTATCTVTVSVLHDRGH